MSNLKMIKREGEVTEEVEFCEVHFTYTHSQPGRVQNVLERYEFRRQSRVKLIRDYRKQGFITEAELSNVSN